MPKDDWKKRKRRRHGGRVRAMKPGCIEAYSNLGELVEKARARGISVKVSDVSCGNGKKTYHFMFDNELGGRLLNYWPGNGMTNSPVTGERVAVRDCWEALAVADRIDCDVVFNKYRRVFSEGQ